MQTQKPRLLSARLVARRISKERAAKRAYELRNRPAHWLTPEQIFAAADALLEKNEPPTCRAVARQLGKTSTDNTVRATMRGYWRNVWERLYVSQR
jgi:hypothetical protein